MKIVTHNNLTCFFKDRAHIYQIKETGQILTSGTTFVKKFFPKFDAVKVSNRIADKRGATPEALRREWAQAGSQAAVDGTAVHTHAEWLTTGRGIQPLSLGNNRVHNLKKQNKRAVERLRKAGMVVVDAEMIIFSAALGIAGTVDLLLSDNQGYIIILDWKTNKELKSENPWAQGFGPLALLDDCNLNHYILQLSLYQYILEAENYFPAAKGFKRIIVHLTEEWAKPYKVKYMKNEIEAMLI